MADKTNKTTDSKPKSENPLIAAWEANGKPNPFVTFGAKNQKEEEEMMVAARAQEEEAKKKYANVKVKDMPNVRQVFGDEYAEKLDRYSSPAWLKEGFKEEHGYDPPHMGNAPANIPDCWKAGDPPLGLAKSMEIAPLSGEGYGDCVVQ